MQNIYFYFFRAKVDFSEILNCKQMRLPVTLFVQNGRHICVSHHRALFDK